MNNNIKNTTNFTYQNNNIFLSDKTNSQESVFILKNNNHFFSRDVRVKNILLKDGIHEEIFFYNVGSENFHKEGSGLIFSFLLENNDFSEFVKRNNSDNRMLFVFEKKRYLKNDSPLPVCVITKNEIFYPNNDKIINNIKTHMKIKLLNIKKIKNGYIKHLENELSDNYYTKRIINNHINEDKKWSSKKKNKAIEKITKFLS